LLRILLQCTISSLCVCECVCVCVCVCKRGNETENIKHIPDSLRTFLQRTISSLCKCVCKRDTATENIKRITGVRQNFLQCAISSPFLCVCVCVRERQCDREFEAHHRVVADYLAVRHFLTVCVCVRVCERDNTTKNIEGITGLLRFFLQCAVCLLSVCVRQIIKKREKVCVRERGCVCSPAVYLVDVVVH